MRKYGSSINEVFTENEIKERYDAMSEKFPDKDFDEIVEITKEDLATDAENMHGIERRY